MRCRNMKPSVCRFRLAYVERNRKKRLGHKSILLIPVILLLPTACTPPAENSDPDEADAVSAANAK